MAKNAMMCPRCRRLIGSQEDVCSWCGTKRSSAWWRLVSVAGNDTGNIYLNWITGACLFLYLLSIVIGLQGGITSPMQMLNPNPTALLRLGATGTIPINYGNLWSLITYFYLHGGIIHIIFNLMALRRITPLVAEEYGANRMFIVYTLGGIIAGIASYAAGVALTTGASGAVCSLIGAIFYYGWSRGGVYGKAAFDEAKGWIISLAIFGLIMPGINNWAHGAGVIAGIFFGWLLGYSERKKENSFHRIFAMFCILLTAFTLAWAMFVLLQSFLITPV